MERPATYDGAIDRAPAVVLTRLNSGEGAGVHGVLAVAGVPVCYTLELPWRNNQPNISCIPPGTYPFKPVHNSPKFGAVPKIESVPGRTDILFHKGNTLQDTDGCVLVGLVCNNAGETRTIHNSRDGFHALRHALVSKVLNVEPAYILIRWSEETTHALENMMAAAA